MTPTYPTGIGYSRRLRNPKGLQHRRNGPPQAPRPLTGSHPGNRTAGEGRLAIRIQWPGPQPGWKTGRPRGHIAASRTVGSASAHPTEPVPTPQGGRCDRARPFVCHEDKRTILLATYAASFTLTRLFAEGPGLASTPVVSGDTTDAGDALASSVRNVPQRRKEDMLRQSLPRPPDPSLDAPDVSPAPKNLAQFSGNRSTSP